MKVMEEESQQDMSTQGLDMSSYVLTIEDASRLFAEAGVPRSPRTVLRYCAQRSLDCVRADTEKNWKYLINEESVRQRVKEVQQISQGGHDASRPAMTGQDETQPDSDETEQVRGENQSLKTKIQELEVENRDLLINSRWKDKYIEKVEEQGRFLLDALQETQYRLGTLEERLGAHFADGERLFRSIVIGRFGDRERSGATPVSLWL
jgi:hypothetical protein